MSSPIGSKRTVKIFVLYLLENINYPLEYCTINDIVMQTDYVMFLDFAESFNEMVDGGLIESFERDGLTFYQVSEKGRIVAQAFKSDVLSSVLDSAMTAALRYLDFTKRGITVIDRKGEPFDPKLENAVMQGTEEDGEPGTVCEVFQKGYMLGESVLRHAMVKVVPQ